MLITQFQSARFEPSNKFAYDKMINERLKFAKICRRNFYLKWLQN